MSLKCFPLLYVNMAGEMIYILEQRIKNQHNISEEKGDLVLHDIISQTLKQKYLHEIFKPQHMFSRRHMRAMFERLAHSSIMRLSESSMEKLFDLTLMMTKYQIQSVVMPEQILTVTMNHLSGMKRIAKHEEDIQELVRNAHAMFLMLYGPVPITEWSLIRCQMLNFFQDCRVKVSVLLRDGKQFDDGHFVYLPQKEPIELPPDVEPPGTTKYYENGEFVKSTQWPVTRIYTPLQHTESRNLDAEVRSTTLGTSIFINEMSVNINGGGGAAKAEPVQYGDEIKLLESLFGSTLKTEGEVDLNMFDSTTEESNYVKETEAALKNVLKIDASKDKKSISTAMSEMKMTPSDEKKKKGKGADMLEMLDEAAARPATGKSRSRSKTRTDPTSKPRTPSGKRPASAKKAPK
ncbi:Protein OSCP1 [Trichostrongylus colubriformis]|uniref:Protein OSCP1 n=1 Tax=Trichostrongylus colubriformis TaxID=6319 RepID=A0AAN8GAP2_TRICO